MTNVEPYATNPRPIPDTDSGRMQRPSQNVPLGDE